MKMYKIVFAILGIAVIIVMIITSVNLISIKNDVNNNAENEVIEKTITNEKNIQINLKLENEEKDIEFTNILIEIPEELENYEIVLPDKTTINENISEYRITENGKYKFILNLEDGTEIEKEIEVSNIKEKKEEEKFPTYIPNGFKYKEGTMDTGYVIVDQYGNEFVWVPVESGILMRNNISKSKYEESDTSAKALVNSVATNYGFYIARYEASKAEFNGNIVATSFAGVNPWNGVSFNEAKEHSEKFVEIFGYDDIKSSLINSFAWDTTLNWLNKNETSYSTSLKYGNYSNELKKCGETDRDCVNNIFDMAGNLREWTTEINKTQISGEENDDKEEKNIIKRVIRGGSAKQNKSASSQISYSEETTEDYWGFRMIIYK